MDKNYREKYWRGINSEKLSIVTTFMHKINNYLFKIKQGGILS